MTRTPIHDLIDSFAKLPGLGQRSARRIALHLLRHRTIVVPQLIHHLTSTIEEIVTCESCGNIDIQSPCSICTDSERNHSMLCVVEDIADLWAIERTTMMKGLYHVLGGTLSAVEGLGPDELRLPALESRVKEGGITEVILATNATLEGQTTAHYIIDMLAPYSITITRLAHGIPLGGELDYLDEATLLTALKSRRVMESMDDAL